MRGGEAPRSAHVTAISNYLCIDNSAKAFLAGDRGSQSVVATTEQLLTAGLHLGACVRNANGQVESKYFMMITVLSWTAVGPNPKDRATSGDEGKIYDVGEDP